MIYKVKVTKVKPHIVRTLSIFNYKLLISFGYNQNYRLF